MVVDRRAPSREVTSCVDTRDWPCGLLAFRPRRCAQRPDQPQQQPVNQDKVKDPNGTPPSTTPPPPPVPSDARSARSRQGIRWPAARRGARGRRRIRLKHRKVFDNDNIPTRAGFQPWARRAARFRRQDRGAASDGAAAPAASKPAANDEKTWRDKFAKLRHKAASRIKKNWT